MRDDVRLVGDLYLPGDGGPHPCLVQRVPYDRRQPGIVHGALDVHRAVERGYAVLVQDCRGRYGSEGDFIPFEHEGEDGEDTVAWVARQDWCDGSVGMFGRSYSGYVQWAAAARRPPALRAIAPMLSGDEPSGDWLDHSGVREHGFALTWGLRHLAPDALDRLGWPIPRADLLEVLDDLGDLLLDATEGPLELFEHLPFLAEGWPGILTHTTPASGQGGGVPALVVAGWFDIFLRGALRTYEKLSRDGRTTLSLVVGPWAHGAALSGVFAERDFGPRSGSESVALTERQLDWFDRWVRRTDPDPTVSSVTWFQMGADRWHSADAWPPPGTRRQLLHMRPGPDGSPALSEEPATEAGSWPLRFDEVDPVPTIGGQTFLPGLEVAGNAGPRDQRRVVGRPDVVHVRGQRLVAPLDVVGDVDLRVRLRPGLPGSSIVARLVEESADGSVHLVSEGAARLPAVTDEQVEVTIRVGSTGHRFATGSRLGLLVSCTSAPRFRRWVTAEPPPAPRSGAHHLLFGPGTASRLELSTYHPARDEEKS